MSGDVQTRQRRKEKKKQKREDDISTVPGVDTSKINEAEKKTVQMHIQESDHHGDHGAAGICAKIIFFTLMAILLGLVTLIVLENRGGSDVDTPLSESRFSEYLQGWVDENREEDHHEEPHFAVDHDDDGEHEISHDDEKPLVADDEPYPEEKDVSNPEDDDHEESLELNAEINNNESEPADDNDNNDDDDDDENNDDDNDNNDDDQQSPDEDENNETDENEVPNMFEDSAPFDEEDDNDDENLNSQENFESVIDNDAGEDLLLQKLAEESEIAQQQQQQSQENDGDEQDEESSSLMVKLGVGALLALVAHQIIIKKISATNRIDSESDSSNDLLSKRRFTMLTSSEEQLVKDESIGDNEEIIEVMMISRPTLLSGSEEEELDGEYSQEEEEEELSENMGEEDEEEFSEDEIVEEFSAEIHSPQTFEDFENMYRPQPERIEETKRKVTFNEPQPLVEKEVEAEMEKRILNPPMTSTVKESAINQKDSVEKLSPDEYEQENLNIHDIDMEEELMGEEEFGEEEEEEPSGEDLLDDEELDYDEESEEDLSEIDDTELMRRLEAKYGKIEDKSTTADDEDASWTKLPESGGGGAQSYMEEFLRQQALEEN